MADNQKDILKLIERLPKRRLSEIEKQVVFIVLERSKLHRDRARSNYDKAFLFFGLFVVLAFLSNLNNVMNVKLLNILFVFGIMVVVLISWIYQTDLKKEDDMLEQMLEDFLH
jgi:Flp pilus assembly protein TadB